MKKKIGQNIKYLRKKRGLSQEEVADGLHISRSAYERMENGKSNSWTSYIEQFSSFFEVTPEYFLQEEYKKNQIGGKENIKILNPLSEKLITQYELRLQEKEVIIGLLKEKIKGLEKTVR